jgi:hypothetical protein
VKLKEELTSHAMPSCDPIHEILVKTSKEMEAVV